MTFLDQMNQIREMKPTSHTTYSVQSEAVPSKPWPIDQRLNCLLARIATCCCCCCATSAADIAATPEKQHPVRGLEARTVCCGVA